MYVHSMTGFDDYPRTQWISDQEAHVDLHTWMVCVCMCVCVCVCVCVFMYECVCVK